MDLGQISYDIVSEKGEKYMMLNNIELSGENTGKAPAIKLSQVLDGCIVRTNLDHEIVLKYMFVEHDNNIYIRVELENEEFNKSSEVKINEDVIIELIECVEENKFDLPKTDKLVSLAYASLFLECMNESIMLFSNLIIDYPVKLYDKNGICKGRVGRFVLKEHGIKLLEYVGKDIELDQEYYIIKIGNKELTIALSQSETNLTNKSLFEIKFYELTSTPHITKTYEEEEPKIEKINTLDVSAFNSSCAELIAYMQEHNSKDAILKYVAMHKPKTMLLNIDKILLMDYLI